MPWYYSAARSSVSGALGLLTGWEVRGRENVPRTGGLILASNHISFWDPPMVGAAQSRELHFLAKRELFQMPLLGPLIASVNSIPIRRGMADLQGMSRAIEVLKRGDALMVFPEGTRIRDGELHPARPGVGLLAVQGDASILPCYISGSDQSSRFWKQRGLVRIWFGVARPWKDYVGPEEDLTPGRALYQAVGDAVMREIAVLRTGQQTSASRGAA
ncbi:MAG: 1-acyl-sn-glycerol-3-phosphate acyltransferase [Candidatus Eisenbacteria bacterium]|uniref:1-acyl-sn-glycerol-3-phosphate acyltransferase n=1 Tax=Eiseniibacteriota bacterium TaxID=2212470 RepID=A0A849SQL9_UNCEI|nr:1-acyl-sn-glycerol-3-phosphate acyltransferase [Candidatus Eisenbacteria bacterium]